MLFVANGHIDDRICIGAKAIKNSPSSYHKGETSHEKSPSK